MEQKAKSKTRLFQPVRDVSVGTRVSEAIRKAIFSWKLRPGDQLLEAHLAQDFHVSQTSVREALFHLEQYGLVRRVPNKSTFVTKLSVEDLKERLDVRMLLEEQAAILATPQMNETHLHELSSRAEAISVAVLQNAYFDLSLVDFDFHHYIWERSGNKVLSQTLDRLSAPLFAFASGIRNAHHDDLRKVVNSHEAIVAALRQGEPEGVREAMRAHFRHSYEVILSHGQEVPESVEATALIAPAQSR